MALKGNLKAAAAFGAPPEILPYFPELLAGMWSLGVPPDSVVTLLNGCHLPAGETSVLDLGCGKGAVSITLARHFGFEAHGIDLYEPFIEEARKGAWERGVGYKCSFRQGDICKAVQGKGEYDLVLHIWVGGVLGDGGKSVGRIRHLIRRGGYMVFGYGCLKDGIRADHPLLQGFERCQTVMRKLMKHGDTVIRQTTIPEDRISDLHRQYIDSLQKGAHKCAREHPEHAGQLWEYVSKHEEMCRVMENRVDSCLWLVKKGSPYGIGASPGSCD